MNSDLLSFLLIAGMATIAIGYIMSRVTGSRRHFRRAILLIVVVVVTLLLFAIVKSHQ